MAPKARLTFFGVVATMALTILAVMTWANPDLAAPACSPIYQPQHLKECVWPHIIGCLHQRRLCSLATAPKGPRANHSSGRGLAGGASAACTGRNYEASGSFGVGLPYCGRA